LRSNKLIGATHIRPFKPHIVVVTNVLGLAYEKKIERLQIAFAVLTPL